MQIGMLGRWIAAAAVSAAVAAGPALAQSDTLASVKQKGKLVVGVKADYKPFGYTDPSGKIVGLEVDLANDVAKRLGVQVELVPVVAANRMEFLKQGRIDLMIATMAYKPDRAEVVGIPEPFYYAGAASVFAKKNSGTQELDRSQGQADLRASRARTTTAAPARSSARSSSCSRA